jgi:hypothetical protein
MMDPTIMDSLFFLLPVGTQIYRCRIWYVYGEEYTSKRCETRSYVEAINLAKRRNVASSASRRKKW